MPEKIEVCAYSRTSAAEVVELVQWAAETLAAEQPGPVWYEQHYGEPAPGTRRAKLLETARTLLWHED